MEGRESLEGREGFPTPSSTSPSTSKTAVAYTHNAPLPLYRPVAFSTSWHSLFRAAFPEAIPCLKLSFDSQCYPCSQTIPCTDAPRPPVPGPASTPASADLS